MTWRKRFGFITATALISVVIFFVAGEGLVRLVSPIETMFPRFMASPTYGHVLYENSTMVHELSGKWQFKYTINQYQYRGRAVSISNSYPVPNIVMLGDSYTFGEGVQDDECFGAVMAEDLHGRFEVINLGVPGWGLTQEIRRYYEFGQLYDPAFVILQFCRNDPEDNIETPVTVVKDGRFQFLPCPDNEATGIKKYLSSSIIQKSQLYNLVAHVEFRNRKSVLARNELSIAETASGQESSQERFYNKLLEAFARDLAERNVHLVMIAVNGQLDPFPLVKEMIENLNEEGVLRYIEVRDWFAGATDYRSPEGHSWGAKAHAIVGHGLASRILGMSEAAIHGPSVSGGVKR